MNNYSDIGVGDYYHNLSHDELIKKNKELRQIISDLRSKQDEYEKCTHTVYAPGKSYKELEEKLWRLENTKNTEIDDLVEQIVNLKEEKQKEIDRLIDTMAQANKEIQSCRQDNYNLKSRNIDLERLIQKQNVILDLAAGYISTSKRFSSTHPMDVKKWLMGGME
jgi:chromosome segregation ATPase